MARHRAALAEADMPDFLLQIGVDQRIGSLGLLIESEADARAADGLIEL